MFEINLKMVTLAVILNETKRVPWIEDAVSLCEHLARPPYNDELTVKQADNLLKNARKRAKAVHRDLECIDLRINQVTNRVGYVREKAESEADTKAMLDKILTKAILRFHLEGNLYYR